MKHIKNFDDFEYINEDHFYPNGIYFEVTFKIEKEDLIKESGISNISDAFDNEMKYVEESGIGLVNKKFSGNTVEATIEADPDTLLQISEYKDTPLTEIVKSELKWLLGSGIIVNTVKETTS